MRIAQWWSDTENWEEEVNEKEARSKGIRKEGDKEN
jgi:hypothetical protein